MDVNLFIQKMSNYQKQALSKTLNIKMDFKKSESLNLVNSLKK